MKADAVWADATRQVLERTPQVGRAGLVADICGTLAGFSAPDRARYMGALRSMVVPEYLGACVFDELAAKVEKAHDEHARARHRRHVDVIVALLQPFTDEQRFAILGVVRERLQKRAA